MLMSNSSVGWTGRRQFLRFENVYRLGGCLILFMSFSWKKKMQHLHIWPHSWEIVLDSLVAKSIFTSDSTVQSLISHLKRSRYNKEKPSMRGCGVRCCALIGCTQRWIICISSQTQHYREAMARSIDCLLASLYSVCLYNVINGKLWCQPSIAFTAAPPAAPQPCCDSKTKERQSASIGCIVRQEVAKNEKAV